MNKEAQDAYHNIRIIASDENKGLKIVPYMREDAELYNALDMFLYTKDKKHPNLFVFSR